MTWRSYLSLVSADLYRVRGEAGIRAAVRELFTGEEGFIFCFWLRTCAFLRSRPLGRLLGYPFARWMMKRLMYRYGIAVEFTTEIGPGFYIGHFGGIVINRRVKIGRDCNISQGVTLGISNRGENAGCPVIGDRVFIGPGAKIFGAVRIGNDVAVAANAVVTKDVPDGVTVGGVPARVINHAGSAGYINNTDYPPHG